MNTTTKELIFLGLPETGKTTFFVALDEVIQRQTDKHGLVSGGFADNRSYIENLKIAWRSGQPVGRTLLPTEEDVELLVQHKKTNSNARLTSPDLHGEFFDDQWTDRKWSVSYRERLASVGGLFVFINALFGGTNPEISAAWGNIQDGKQTPQSKPWTPRSAAKQVKLIDLLQFVSERGKPLSPLPLVVMVSAWDLVEQKSAPKLRPEKFLERDWSLLHQFLQANPELFQSKIYGVSARGGTDQDQAELVRLAPHERVWLKDGDEVSKDLTRPLRWMLGWD